MAKHIIIEGDWFDGKTSKAQPSRFVVTNADTQTILIEFPNGDTHSTEILEVSDRLGNVDRQLKLADGSTFITFDNDGVDQLPVKTGGWFSYVSSIEVFDKRLLVFLAIIIVLFYGIFAYGLPATARFAAWATPPKIVELMDASSLSTLDQIALGKSKLDNKKKQILREDFQRLVQASNHDAPFKLLFRDGGRIGPNALALPAGTIIVTDQIVALVNHDELMAILAHEVSHVTHNHSLRQLYRALGFAGLMSVIAGDFGTIAEELFTGGTVLVAMSASREMETEADAKAVPLLRKIDVDPINLSSGLDKLYAAVCKNADCEKSGWFASHPGGEERRKALEVIIRDQ